MARWSLRDLDSLESINTRSKSANACALGRITPAGVAE